jgi:hypothetical protein
MPVYVPIASSEVPEGIRWKPIVGQKRTSAAVTLLSTPGGYYKSHRVLATGEITYYKLDESDVPATPKEKIDAEPTPAKQVRYRTGSVCWYVAGGRWFAVEVVKRTGMDRATYGEPSRVTIKSRTGWDADRVVEWPFGEELEFVANPRNMAFLRPLKARK